MFVLDEVTQPSRDSILEPLLFGKPLHRFLVPRGKLDTHGLSNPRLEKLELDGTHSPTHLQDGRTFHTRDTRYSTMLEAMESRPLRR